MARRATKWNESRRVWRSAADLKVCPTYALTAGWVGLMGAIAAVSLHAAVIRGVVVENFTSKPLARAQVALQPVGGTPGAPKAMRADSHGMFVFASLATGAYIVRATRNGFMSAEYGQKRWNSAGMPVMLEKEEDSVFLDIRLFRYSAISGTLVDENDEGLPGYEVLAYRNSKPPELMAHATSDERGIYRLHGLTPGTYVVRTAGNQSNDGSFLPTYSKEADKLDQARAVELYPDQEADNMDVRPLPGSLYSLAADVERIPPGQDASITLVSETGRKTVAAEKYRFTHLPPGEYDVFARSPANPGDGESFLGAYQHVFLGADTGVSLMLRSPSGVSVAGAPANSAAEIRIRQAGQAGAEPSSVPLRNGAATIPIGRWEVMLLPPDGYYVSAVSGSVSAANRWRPDGWQEVTSPPPAGFGGVRFTVSAGPSAIHGAVKGSDGPVSGVPVYLEAYNQTAGSRVADLRTAITDMHGQYRLDGLASGTYRILGTFEYLSPDVEVMGAAGAQLMTLDAHSDVARDLELYIIR